MRRRRTALEALEDIWRDAPEEEPKYDDWGGDTERAERWGQEHEHWRLARIARSAVPEPQWVDASSQSTELRLDARKLLNLLEEPEPGLATWGVAVGDRLDRLVRHSSRARATRRALRDLYDLFRAVDCGEHDDDPAFRRAAEILGADR